MDVRFGLDGASEVQPKVNFKNIYHLIGFDKLHADANSDSRPLMMAKQHRKGVNPSPTSAAKTTHRIRSGGPGFLDKEIA
jgi:hypothetical protein